VRSALPALLSLLLVACAATDDGRPPLPEVAAPSDGLANEPADPLDVIDRISAWNERLSDADRRTKYCKMAGSPFVFFRGTNHLFWEDNRNEPILSTFSSSSTLTWLQGDLHAENFGAFDNDDGAIVYDLNDFDETLIGDYQYDLWRMATSLVLIAEGNGNLADDELDATLLEFADAYLTAMAGYAGGEAERGVAFTADALTDPLREFVEDVEARNDRVESLDDWTRVVGGQRIFDLDLDELAPLSGDEEAALAAAMPGYGDSLSGGLSFDPNYFAIKSTARRLLAGTGSIGTPRIYALIEGPSSDVDDDRILDIKQQQLPSALAFTDRTAYDDQFANHAQRHAIGYKALASDVDDHLGVMLLGPESFSVRERSVFKKTFRTNTLAAADYPTAAAIWGTILATAHARSDADAQGSLITTSVDDAITELVGARPRELERIIADLATDYAAQVGHDYERFVNELAPNDCP